MTSAERVLSLAVISVVSASVAACKVDREPANPAPEPVAQSATTPPGTPTKPAPPEPPPAGQEQPVAPVEVGSVHEALSFRIDGVEAEYLGQGEGDPSSSHWKIADAIGSAPKFAFELGETQALGTVRTVILKFYPMWKGEYVARPGPVIVSAARGNPDLQMKSGVTYDLGALGPDFKVMDVLGRAARRFGLRPGVDYKMEVVFEGRRSHIAVIFMKVTE